MQQSLKAEIIVVGGGMAGLSAAQAFHQKGKKVVLIEQYYCGAGASGKSSGFITPNSEISLTNFKHRYGSSIAQKIWNFIISGGQLIKNNIEKYHIDCNYIAQNTLLLANTDKAVKELLKEYKTLKELDFKTRFINKSDIPILVNTKRYYGGVEYFDSFGINGYLYCQAMKNILIDAGVRIYEETPATSIEKHTVHTPYGVINADYIIICADRFIPQLGKLTQKIYQMQTFLGISQSLTDQQVRTLFPKETYMVWDSDLVYTYYRMTTNNRLLIGGGTLWTTYTNKEKHQYKPIINKLHNYLRTTFPDVQINIEYIWPGLIGISKDLAPIAGRDVEIPSIYYIGAAAGLPIAAAIGNYSAEHIINGKTDFDEYFSPYRSFPIGNALQSIVGKKASFVLSNLISLNK